MHEIDGVADEQLGEAHRCRHLDPRLRARPQDGDAAGKKHRDHVDQDEHEQELRPEPSAHTTTHAGTAATRTAATATPQAWMLTGR